MGFPKRIKNIAAGHTEHHYVDGTCTICGKKEPAPVEPDGPSSDNERTYAIVTEDNGHGSVTVSADEASAGTRITVTVKPDAGYELDELTVTDAKNKDLKVTKRSETTYTFHMADSKVTVEASFTKDGTVQKPDTRFDDVAKSAWYYKAVEYVAGERYHVRRVRPGVRAQRGLQPRHAGPDPVRHVRQAHCEGGGHIC